MRALNLRFRGIDRATDVLSFPLFSSPAEFPQEGDFPLGDIVISPRRAEEQAREYGVTLREELRRLIAHGLLHLMGFDHEKNAYQKRKMREKEQKLMEAMRGK